MKFHLVVHALGESFNGEDSFPIRALGRIDARDHRLAVHKDSTSAALCLFTSDLRAGQAQSLAEECGECFAPERLKIMRDTINRKRDLIHHSFLKSLNHRD